MLFKLVKMKAYLIRSTDTQLKKKFIAQFKNFFQWPMYFNYGENQQTH